MATFKTLSPDDVSRVPFNANKQFTFVSSSASTVGVSIDSFSYSSSTLNTFSSASTDTLNTIKYYQIDHLFYRNHKLNISNTLGDADYLDEERNLYNKTNVLSIPSNLYGNKIKPGSFQYSGSNGVFVDDKKGNLLISGTNLISHSIDEREKIVFLGPVKGFKQYNVNYNLYGKTNPNPKTYFNKEKVYDDSYYNNTVEYKNIIFKEEDYGNGIKVPAFNFIRNAGENSVTNGGCDYSGSWNLSNPASASYVDEGNNNNFFSTIPSLHHQDINSGSYGWAISASNEGLTQTLTNLKEETLYEITWDIFRPTGSLDVTN